MFKLRFSITIYWRCRLFSNIFFLVFLSKIMQLQVCAIIPGVLYSILLMHLSAFVPLPYCYYCSVSVVQFKNKVIPPAIRELGIQTWPWAAIWAGTSPWPQVAELATHNRLLLSTLRSLVSSLSKMLKRFCVFFSHLSTTYLFIDTVVSAPHNTTRDHGDVPGLGSHLRPHRYPRAVQSWFCPLLAVAI